MSERQNLCVLVAEVVGWERLVDRLGSTESSHALERCLNRIDRSIEANGGHDIGRTIDRVIVSFERCDSGVIAACEMLERVLSLPPASGTQLKVRIGLHYGLVDASGEGEGVADAIKLARASRPGQALASNTAVMLLTPSARHFAGAEAFPQTEDTQLDWPVFAIGNRVGQVTSLPPNARISQRLRLRHQQDIMFVEEQRPIVLIGRELGNDVVIIDPRASRQHARIERRREGFVLIDQSTNGCYLSLNGDDERCIKTSETPLSGSGRIGCGFSSKEIERDLIFFDVV